MPKFDASRLKKVEDQLFLFSVSLCGFGSHSRTHSIDRITQFQRSLMWILSVQH